MFSDDFSDRSPFSAFEPIHQSANLLGSMMIVEEVKPGVYCRPIQLKATCRVLALKRATTTPTSSMTGSSISFYLTSNLTLVLGALYALIVGDGVPVISAVYMVNPGEAWQLYRISITIREATLVSLFEKL